MKLRPLEDCDFNRVAGWLEKSENYQWLDFGSGLQILSPALLKMMSRTEKHCLRLYAPSGHHAPLGLVGLSNIDKHFQTAILWYVLGGKSFANQGHTMRAVSALLNIGFGDMGLRAIQAWAVEGNQPSIRVLEKNGFHYIGTQRSCHTIAGTRHNRLLFDLLGEDFHQDQLRSAA